MITKKTGCFKLVATANPQDYYTGGEPEDLRVTRVFNTLADAMEWEEHYAREGYTVCVTFEADDGSSISEKRC